MENQRAATESTQDGTAAERFAEQLRELRIAVGNPSFRKMAGKSGRISHTTLHEAAAGTRFPSWETTREFVRACEADEAEWRRRWEDVQRPMTGTVDTTATEVVAADPLHALDTPVEERPAAASSSDLVPVGQRALRTAEHPQAPAEIEVTRVRRRRMPQLVAAAVVVVAALAAGLGIVIRGRSAPEDSAPVVAAPSSAGFSDSLIPGDSSKFVADITVPDGSQVKVNASFDKVWAIENVGTVAWHKRFLAPTNATSDGCRVPDRVAIGDTPPGEQVMIRVRVVAPSRPGKCWVSWKMVDENGQPYFPSRRPIYFLVNVVA